jgi:hypothetical protein
MIKDIETIQKREAEQQYSTPAKERNSIPNNKEGSNGDTVIVNNAGNKSFYIKTFNGWFKMDLTQNINQSSAPTESSETASEETSPGLPSGSIEVTRVSNQTLRTTWEYGANTVSHKLFRSSSPGQSFTNPGVLINQGTSNSFHNDNLESETVGAWTYKMFFFNSGAENNFIQEDTASTISAYLLRQLDHLSRQIGLSSFTNLPYTSSQLLEAAEKADIDSSNTAATTGALYTDDINFTVNASKMYGTDQGQAVNFYGTSGSFNDNGNHSDSYTGGWFGQDHPTDATLDVVLNIDDDGDIIGKYSSVPAIPSFTKSATVNSVIVNLSAETYVTRHWKVQIDTVNTFDSGALQTLYVTPSVKGTTTASSATGTATFSSNINSNTTYFIRARAQNGSNTGSPLHTSDFSTTQSVTTSTAGSWSNIPSDFTLTGFGFNGADFSDLFQVTLNSGTGNTTISCSQSGLSGVLWCDVSTSGDPGQNHLTYGPVKTITHSGSFTNQTYYVRFYYQRTKSINNNTTQDVTFTNSTNVNTDLDITCIGTS